MKPARLGVLVLLLLMAAAPATGPATLPADLEELKQKAISDDFDSSRTALRALAAKGTSARPLLHDIAGELLSRDKARVIENAALLADVAKYKEIEHKLAVQRKLARENIGVLERDQTVKEAAENYRLLRELLKQSPAPLKSGIFDSMRRRPELLGIWRQSPSPANGNPFQPADEAKLVALAEKSIGMPLPSAAAFATPTNRNEPTDPSKWNFWFYRLCRDVESYNAAFEPLLDKEEMANVRATNAYREALGVLPVELDARLIQAARRHSKEMSDLNYFSHHSPNQSEFDFPRRYRSAGYMQLGSENIARGMTSGQWMFKIWFDSPAHHVNMVRPENTSIGVGRWNIFWTANFGIGPRLMWASEAERKRAVVKGEILKPAEVIRLEEEKHGLPGLPPELFDK